MSTSQISSSSPVTLQHPRKVIIGPIHFFVYYICITFIRFCILLARDLTRVDKKRCFFFMVFFVILELLGLKPTTAKKHKIISRDVEPNSTAIVVGFQLRNFC